MKPNIVFLDAYSICGCDLAAIKCLGSYTGYDYTRPEEVLDRCRDAEVVITNKVVLSGEILRALPRLQLICIAATGMNNVDMKSAQELGIAVRNAIGYSTYAVAETTLSAALSLYRQVVHYDHYIKSGDYSASPVQFNFARPTHQLHAAHWGIIGLGNIGHRVAQLATAFGCQVCYTSTSGVVRTEPYSALSLDQLLSWADVLSIHCPLTESTHNLIDHQALARMKSSAIIINVARGGIIDEQALATALNAGVIAGAALDVFAQEPPSVDNPLLHLTSPDKLLLSPHNAWSPMESIDRLIDCIARNINDFYNKESL